MMLQQFARTRIAWIVPLFLGGPLVYAQFTTGVSLVEVYATVTDARGEPVTDLKSADFHVRQDGAPQTITTFTAGPPALVGNRFRDDEHTVKVGVNYRFGWH